MRWTRLIGIASCLAAVAGLAGVVSCTRTEANKNEGAAMTQEEKIALGKRLTWTSGCQDCHTPGTFYGAPDTTRLLSGSELGWHGPWGVTYPRNLTPDSTGLAAWTEEQIVTAFREGRRPDGSPVLPPMPWPAYAFLPDNDAYAIAAYLKSLPPIQHRNLDRIAPGAPPTGAYLSLPMPPPWDGQNLPPQSASSEGGAHTSGGTH